MPDCTPEVMKWMEEVEFNDGDVIIDSHPSSGIHWIQEMVWHTRNMDMIGKEKKEDLGTRVNFLEHEHYGKPPWEIQKGREPGTLMFKSHLPSRFLHDRILKGKVRVIVWLMNPRNVLAKYFRLYNTTGKHLNYPHVDWPLFWEMFKADQLCEGNWFDHAKSWLPLVNLPNVLFLRYEDVEKDRVHTVRRVVDFLGKQFTEEEIQKLADVVPFDKPGNPKAIFSEEQMKEFNSLYKEKMGMSLLGMEYLT